MNGPYDRYRLVVQEVERRNGFDHIVKTRDATSEDLRLKGYARASEVDRLKSAIKDAPHGLCDTKAGFDCNCWKSRV